MKRAILSQPVHKVEDYERDLAVFVSDECKPQYSFDGVEYEPHAGRKSLAILVSILLGAASGIGIGALILWSI